MPGIWIPYGVQQLTGITEQMVGRAPAASSTSGACWPMTASH
jgi:hypothetical protein